MTQKTWTDLDRQKVVECIQAGGTVIEAAALLGVSPNALSSHMRNDIELQSAVRAAREAAHPPRPPKPEDTRPFCSTDQVSEAIELAAEAMGPALAIRSRPTADPRFRSSEAWGGLRAHFHSLGDEARREAILRLVLEEAGRIRADRDVSFQPKAKNHGHSRTKSAPWSQRQKVRVEPHEVNGTHGDGDEVG